MPLLHGFKVDEEVVDTRFPDARGQFARGRILALHPAREPAGPHYASATVRWDDNPKQPEPFVNLVYLKPAPPLWEEWTR